MLEVPRSKTKENDVKFANAVIKDGDKAGKYLAKRLLYYIRLYEIVTK